jgi:hypothetical protein
VVVGRAMQRCQACGAGLWSDAATCPACRRSVVLDLDLEVLDHDDEVGSPPPPEGERPAGLRTVAIGAAVASALILGALVVGMGESSSSAPTVLSTAPPTTAGDVRPADRTPGMTFRQVRGRGPMLPESTGTVLYGLTQDGSLVRVDLDDGDVTWRNLQLSDAPSDHQLLARTGAVVVAPANRQRPRLVADTLTGRVDEAPFDGPILFGPAPDELWLLSGRGEGDVYATAQRVKLDGTPVGAELALPPLFVLGSDGAGAPLLWGLSGTYLVDPVTSTWTRVSEQRLVGWGAAAFVDLGCDGGLPCHWRVHDRRTGETRLLPEPAPEEALQTFDRGRVSPDGQWLARVGRGGSSLQVVDLATGALRDLVAEGDGIVSDLAWSPDGHWLFWLGADQITTWKVGTADPVVLSGLGFVPDVVALTASGPSSPT